jgi:hypothetical protein
MASGSSPGSPTPPSPSSSQPPAGPDRRNAEAVEHQDQSIKVRKSQLFEAPKPTEVSAALKPFAEYVRATPAAPLSPGVKAALWGVGSLIVLILIAAILFGRNPRTPRGRRAGLSPDRHLAVVLRPARVQLPGLVKVE